MELLKDISRNLFFVCFLLILLEFFDILIVSMYVNVKLLVFICYISLFVWIFFLIKDKKEYEVYFKYSFLVLLFLIALSSLRFEFIDNLVVLKVIIEFLNNYQFHLTMFTIFFGFITFYYNRDVVDLVEKEKNDEEKAEKKRAGEFDKKFKRLSWFNFDYGIYNTWKKRKYLTAILKGLISPFIWLARLPYSFVKWMYKEGWWYSVLLITIIIIGFILRILIADSRPFFRDAYNILLNAKINYFIGEYIYIQSWYLIELQTLLYKIIGFTTNRIINTMPYIIMGIVNIFLIYLITKKIINKKVGLISSLILSISIFSIELSTYIRHYEYFLLLILISIIIIINVKKLIYLISFGIIYSIFIIYSLLIADGFFTSVIFIFPFFIYKLYILINFHKIEDYYNSINKKLLFIVILFCSLFIFYLIYFFFNKTKWLINYNYDSRWFTFIYLNSFRIEEIQIFFSITVLLISIYFLFFHKSNLKWIKLIIITNIFILLIYTFLFGRYYAPRYIYYLYPFYIILIFSGLYFLFYRYNKIIKSILLLVLVIFFSTSFYNQLNTTSNYNGLIGTYSYEIDSFHEFIKNSNIDIQNDYFISANSGELFFFFYEFKNKNDIKITNIDLGYQATHNYIMLSEFNEYNFSNIDTNIYIITDWIRNPFSPRNKGKDFDMNRIKNKEQLFNKAYKVYLVEIKE